MYSDEEVDAAVRRYLSTDVETTRTKTGARNIVSAKEQIYDLVTTTLLLEPRSYYYVIWLASNKLTGLLVSQIADMATIATAAPNTSRQAKLLGAVTELVNAEAAIVDLNTAFTTRSQGVTGTLGPGVERFRTAVERYIKAELTKNVIVAGDVVETGDELKQKIRTTWDRALQRHLDIITLSSSIQQALQTFRAVKLPDSAVRKVVSRIQAKLQELQTTLSSPSAVRDSRSAMLDLLAMRTLLLRCSSFKAPQTKLAPLGIDVVSGTLVNSTGTRAAVQGTISAPYNHDLGTVLSLSVNGGTPVAVNFPGSSRALLETSATLSFPVPAGMEVAIRVNGSTTTTMATSAWANGTAAAAALDAGLTGVDVAWDGATSRLVFRSQSTGDVSQLDFLDGSLNRENFLSWAFESGTPTTRGVPLEASALLLLFPPSIAASIVDTTLVTFTGSRSAVGGEEAVLWHSFGSGADLTGNGTTSVTASIDLEARGVVPGMKLAITAPAPLTRTILAVDGATLTVDTAVPAATHTYYVGPDYAAIPAGARVSISGTDLENQGYFRVVSGNIAKLTLDRNIPVEDAAILSHVFTTYLRLEARGTSTTSGIGVTASTGATAVGLAPVAEVKAGLSVFRISGDTDFFTRGISPSDLLHLDAPGGGSYDTVIATVDAKELAFSPPVPYEAGSWFYEVSSVQGATYDDYETILEGFLASVSATAKPIDHVVSRLLSGARYSADLTAVIQSYQGALATVYEGSTDYAVERDTTVDQIIRTFQEEGYDRALDLFIGLDLAELFSMSDDGVSYSSWLIRQSATVAREVVPVTKDPRDVNQWRTISTQSTSFDPRAEPEIK